MAAKLEWTGNVLTLSGVALYIGIAEFENGHWEAYGDASYGSVLGETWEAEEDARQDVVSDVRRLLREAGVEVEP